MKNIPIKDMLFILMSTIILIGINYFSNPEVIGKYSLLVAMVSYFIGKAVKKQEIKNNK